VSDFRPNRYEGVGVYSLIPSLISDPQTLTSHPPPQNPWLNRSAFWANAVTWPYLQQMQNRVQHRPPTEVEDSLFSDSDVDDTEVDDDAAEPRVQDELREGTQRDPAPPNDKDWWGKKRVRF
jgi:hypothetical protein